MSQPNGDDPRRRIPRTDGLLVLPEFAAASERLGMKAVKAAVVGAQARARSGELAPEDVAHAALASLPDGDGPACTLRPLLNATGVVLHTNIGRAPLAAPAREATLAASGYVDVEFDIDTGRRARRGRGTLAALRAAVPAAEGALVVNNGAAALVLATTALAVATERPEIVVSRGEMVEIGDGFRLPDLIESTGARLREVGTTNRTTADDYAAAVGDRTGAVLKVHPSNFRVEGFTSAASVTQLATVCAGRVPLVVDIGSGLLAPDPLLPDEPDATTTLRDGASLVTSSGDKLLGGPQAGILLGATDVVERLRRHPLARALRVDKLALAALEATLRGGPTPTHRYLHADEAALRARTEALAAALAPHVGCEVVPAAGKVGGGGAPGFELPGWALALPESFAAALRAGDPGVVGRVEHDRTLLDLRCVEPDDEAALVDAVLAAARLA